MTDTGPDHSGEGDAIRAVSELDANASSLWGRVIIEELYATGVRHVCVSPGSRSTPLTLAAAAHPHLLVHNHIDERSAAFFALGCAKISGTPAAMICTSGTAGAHFLPAMIEAFYTRIPLIALTADRPVELMDAGAGQTIEQKGLFGPHTRAEAHLENPHLTALALRHLRQSVQRMVAYSRGQLGTGSLPGPVHLNVPFTEPLEPTLAHQAQIEALAHKHPRELRGRQGGLEPWIEHAHNPSEPTEHVMTRLLIACSKAQRGVIVCGPLEPTHSGLTEPMLRLLDLTGFVLMADPLSSVRHSVRHPNQVSAYDAFLRAKEVVAQPRYGPDLVIRLGRQPTSKAYRLWREAHPSAEEILIDPYGQALDEVQQASQVIYADPASCVRKLCAALKQLGHMFAERSLRQRALWLERFNQLDNVAMRHLKGYLKENQAGELCEGRIAHDVVAHTGAETTLFLASSMPVRDVDAFSHPRDALPRRLVANRGANGIDGLIATAAGVSCAEGKRCVLLIGDVAFLHDVGSLLSTTRSLDPRAPLRLDIVVINNHGGGIFAHLPIAKHGDKTHFERHFITPHAVEIEALCRAYALPYRRLETLDAWREHSVQWAAAALEEDNPSGAHVVTVTEAIVDRETNVRLHRELWAGIVEELDRRFKRPEEAAR